MADAAGAREQAREILSGSRYHDASVPRPFKGTLDWIGNRIDDVGNWFSGVFDGLDGALPGGGWVVWILLAIAVAVAAVLVSRSAIRRRARASAEARAEAERAVDPRDLEHEADAAERAGDFERAVRLRFRAGVARLDLDVPEAQTTGAIAATLHDPVFDRIGTDHDEIAYGGREAHERDAEVARDGWREVLR